LQINPSREHASAKNAVFGEIKMPAAQLMLDLPSGLRRICAASVEKDREHLQAKVNRKSCGIVWCPPWRVDVTDAVKPGENKLQIEVVNFRPNRIIGDAGLPPDQRLTRTNIRNLKANTPLMESGPPGPVQILTRQ
jgi:hypothetical protein